VPACIDHIVFGAASLDEGSRWLEERLGVPLSPGGRHLTMGTHNRVLRIGDGIYLEVIAADPTLPAPSRPMWLSLGTQEMQARLAYEPRLLTFVARVDAIEDIAARLPLFGRVENLSRGAFSWQFAFPRDGSLIEEGVLPYLIRWNGGSPAEALPESGVTFEGLSLRHPEPERVAEVLAAAGFELAAAQKMLVRASAPGLTLTLNTPRGPIAFSS
jgi:hypothetical protein